MAGAPVESSSLSHPDSGNAGGSARVLLVVIWLIGIALALLDAWAYRFWITPDGVSYLDMGRAWFEGHWQTALNGYFGALYALLTGLGLALIRPSAYWELPVVHGINVVIFVLVMACFHWMLRQVRRAVSEVADHEHAGASPLPEWAWVVVAYAAFLWCSFYLIAVRTITPDLLLSGWIYLACGLALRAGTMRSAGASCVLLGLVLGLAYLTKGAAVVFIIIVFVLVAWLRLRRSMGWRCLPLAFASLLVVVSPYVAALSIYSGRFTVGQSGALNWAWNVNDSLPFRHWQGGDGAHGRPIHPTRQILDDPPVFEFAEPIRATYPPWYDPAYWNEGIRPYWSTRQVLRNVAHGVKDLTFEVLFYPAQFALLAGWIALWAGRGRLGKTLRLVGSVHLVLLLPAVVGIGVYLITHVEGRYVAPYVVMLWVGAFAAIRWPVAGSNDDGRTGAAVAVAVCVLLSFAARTALLVLYRDGPSPVIWRVASGLRDLGIDEGARVGVIGNGAHESPWAYLGRLRIVAELPLVGHALDRYGADTCFANPAVVDAFHRAGVQAIVARHVPDRFADVGWQRIGQTDRFVLVLEPRSTSRPATQDHSDGP